MNGKIKCEALKKIRKDIAKSNGIKLEIPECTHVGDCPGTCPRCESEVRYLERALDERRRRGLKVAIAGVSAGLVAVSATSCDFFEPKSPMGDLRVLAGDIPALTETSDETGSICDEKTDGIMPVIDPDSTIVAPEILEGVIAESDEYVLEGDIAFVPEVAGGIGPIAEEEYFENEPEVTDEETDTETAEVTK